MNKKATVVYIVPTRALIHQVQSDTEKLLKQRGVDNVSVAVLPLQSSYKKDQANFFIFTQERLHVCLAAFSDISIDFMIVDEAQKIGDGYRGILLQQAIEAVVCKNSNCKIIFASPMTNNPEVLLDDAPERISIQSILSEDVMVNQNLIWVSQHYGQPEIWDVDVVLDKKPVQIGFVELPNRPTSVGKRLPFVAYSMSNLNGGNVIYANGPAEAEKMSSLIYDLLGKESELLGDNDIDNLVELIEKTIHPDYKLANVIRRGVAFHYGNMPVGYKNPSALKMMLFQKLILKNSSAKFRMLADF